MKRTLVVGMLLLAACGGSEEGSEPRSGNSPAAATTPSPTLDLDTIAIDVRDATQAILDERLSPGKIELGSASFREEPPYGDLLVIPISQTKVSELKTAVFVLLAMSEAAASNEPLVEASSHIAFSDPAGGRGVVSLEDVQAYAEGEIDELELRDRVIFDF